MFAKFKFSASGSRTVVFLQLMTPEASHIHVRNGRTHSYIKNKVGAMMIHSFFVLFFFVSPTGISSGQQ